MSMKEKSVNCLGKAGFHRIAYTEWGAPDAARTLICVHGLTRNGRDFDTLASALEDQYRIICPDVVGQGKERLATKRIRISKSDLSGGPRNLTGEDRRARGRLARYINGRHSRHADGDGPWQSDQTADYQ